MNSTVSKASAGALELIDVHAVGREEEFLGDWRKDGDGVVVSTAVSRAGTVPISP